jgi:hypothetical protein
MAAGLDPSFGTGYPLMAKERPHPFWRPIAKRIPLTSSKMTRCRLPKEPFRVLCFVGAHAGLLYRHHPRCFET